MIDFSCKCGHAFSVEDEEAGGLIQCPRCRLLVDIPSHGERESLADDGTFRIGDAPRPDDPGRLSDLAYVWGKRRVDAAGNEIDLRNTPDDYAGLGEYDLNLEAPPRRDRPRYDPETGELVRPLEVRADDAPAPASTIPLAKPAISYARRRTGDEERIVTFASAPAELFRPMNLAVMGFVFIGHLIFNLLVFTAISGIIIILVGVGVMFMLLISHPGVLVDEIGPQEQDELPRPLRSLGWHEDLWGPFMQVVVALGVSFLPVWIALSLTQLPQALYWLVVGVAVIAGIALLPAVLLTTTTSGTLLNLRPDRVLGVIHRCGPVYPLLALEAAGVLLLYVGGAFGSIWSLLHLMDFTLNTDLGPLKFALFTYPALCAGIYLLHLFCWHLGIMYRLHQPQFPWVLQRHTAKKQHPIPPKASAKPHRRVSAKERA